MFALYPNASMGEATVAAWFSYLEGFDLAVVTMALDRAIDASPSFVPTAPAVREHCGAVQKTLAGPKIDMSRPQLPEAVVDLPPGLDEIRQRVNRGELSGEEGAKAYLRWASENPGV